MLRASWRSWLANDMSRQGPYWLQWVWTLAFALVVAFGFTVLGFLSFGRDDWRSPANWWHWYRINLVVSAVIAFLIHALFELTALAMGRHRVQSLQGPWRAAYYAGVPISGVLIGWPFGAWLVSGASGFHIGAGSARLVIGMLAVSLLITLVLYQWFESKAREVHAERRATEARLQLLQAQIEPHFLFNTLANVVSLIDHDAPRAKQMLESFTDYLRASLGELRREHSTVGAELDMAEAYLRLLQLRMEDRLNYSIEASDAARAVQMPPLLLQPLVENAITHGLEPKVEGGRIAVRAALVGHTLRLQVEDDGLGQDAPARPPAAGTRGSGLALQNIRQRLASRFGDAATLQLDALAPGTRATLTLPLP